MEATLSYWMWMRGITLSHEMCHLWIYTEPECSGGVADFRSEAEHVKMTLDHLTPEARGHQRPSGVFQGTLREQALLASPAWTEARVCSDSQHCSPWRLFFLAGSLVLTNQLLTLRIREHRDRGLVFALPCPCELYFSVTRYRQE